MSQSYLKDQLSLFLNNRTLKNKVSWFIHNYEKYFPLNKNASILEIGPGFGELMDHLIISENYTLYRAVDINKDVVDHCNSKHDKRVTHITSLENYFADHHAEKYDVIIMLHVLEHINKKNVVDTLSILRNALKEGGILIIEVPNIANPIVGLYMYYSDFTHETQFTSTSLSYLVKNAGFNNAFTVSCNVPPTNIFRIFQRILQLFVELIFKILYKIYLPSMKVYLTHSIGIVAKK